VCSASAPAGTLPCFDATVDRGDGSAALLSASSSPAQVLPPRASSCRSTTRSPSYSTVPPAPPKASPCSYHRLLASLPRLPASDPNPSRRHCPALGTRWKAASAAASYAVHTPEEVFRDYRACRTGMIKALTTGMRAPPPIGLLSSAAETN
jgi:hypothetical protein